MKLLLRISNIHWKWELTQETSDEILPNCFLRNLLEKSSCICSCPDLLTFTQSKNMPCKQEPTSARAVFITKRSMQLFTGEWTLFQHLHTETISGSKEPSCLDLPSPAWSWALPISFGMGQSGHWSKVRQCQSHGRKPRPCHSSDTGNLTTNRTNNKMTKRQWQGGLTQSSPTMSRVYPCQTVTFRENNHSTVQHKLWEKSHHLCIHA